MNTKRKFSVFNELIHYITVTPYLYRYENIEFIDRFFKTGEIFISSFHNYRRYEDNQLGDKREGTSMNIANTDDGKMIGSYTISGSKEYAFCTSTILDRNLFETFRRDSVFRIKDPMNFIIELTRSIHRVNQVLHGHCLYLDNRILTKNVNDLTFDSLKVEGGISAEKIAAVSDYVTGLDDYFLKQKVFQHQSEYRIIWQTDRIVREGIVINCPEAIRYCEQLDIN